MCRAEGRGTHLFKQGKVCRAGLPAWIANRADGAWIGSWIVVFNLPQSPANLYRRHFKMPVSGLPTVLELTIDSILENGKLASYKIAGNGPRTTIVLRFDTNMADTSVSPIHQSTPLRRKSTNQRRQERERLEEHENPSTKKIVQQKFGSNACRDTTMYPQICGDDSALHSQSVFDTATCTGLETKQTETQRENSPNNSLPLVVIVVTINTTEMSNSLLIRQQGKEPRRKRRQE